VENGLNQYVDVTNGAIAVDADGKIGPTNYFATVTFATGVSATVDALNTSFATYFDGNQNAAFNSVKGGSLEYKNGVFVLSNNAILTYNGKAYSVSPEVLEALKSSTYAEKMGSETLSEQMDSVSGLVQKLVGKAFNEWVDSGYMDEPSSPFYNMAMNEDYWEFIGMDEDTFYEMLDVDPDATASYLANGLVLYAANGSSGLNTQTISNAIASDAEAYVNGIKAELNNGNVNALSEAALIYGVYTSYVYDTMNATDAANAVASVNGTLGLINALEAMQTDAAFQTYMAGQGQNDMEAFIGSMGVIKDVAADKDTANKVMTEGFTEDELAGLLANILGK
jgi:hypothetical protein